MMRMGDLTLQPTPPVPPEIEGYLKKLKRKTRSLAGNWNKRWFLWTRDVESLGTQTIKPVRHEFLVFLVDKFDNFIFKIQARESRLFTVRPLIKERAKSSLTTAKDNRKSSSRSKNRSPPPSPTGEKRNRDRRRERERGRDRDRDRKFEREHTREPSNDRDRSRDRERSSNGDRDRSRDRNAPAPSGRGSVMQAWVDDF
ncbi:2-oxoisovalerate dehydrogenase alpha subunit [Phytophthora nicotianae]|uniref:2-oxoisovalerate dehydrogenase alpha subunit n=1 Tax=Phytophthora nicotianae TaxID=4792 RepID=A0A0W8CR53_PHYNI|nr:2-oxoisovalerate dehydrogenase alpha subunit [Phytophthora nicotianae]